jgi:hypothetical protein
MFGHEIFASQMLFDFFRADVTVPPRNVSGEELSHRQRLFSKTIFFSKCADVTFFLPPDFEMHPDKTR